MPNIRCEYGVLNYNHIGRKEYCINLIHVWKGHRRKGYGTELVKKLFKRIKQGNIYLIASNGHRTPVKDLIKWYESLGFKTILPYKEGENDVEMMITLRG